jgi:hypothetical protein
MDEGGPNLELDRVHTNDLNNGGQPNIQNIASNTETSATTQPKTAKLKAGQWKRQVDGAGIVIPFVNEHNKYVCQEGLCATFKVSLILNKLQFL